MDKEKYAVLKTATANFNGSKVVLKGIFIPETINIFIDNKL